MEENNNSGDYPWNPGFNKKEYILCAALWFKDDTKYEHQPKNVDYGLVITGRRHHNAFHPSAQKIYPDGFPEVVEGFLTSHDYFLTRSEAMILAIKTKQTHRTDGELYSEDLY